MRIAAVVVLVLFSACQGGIKKPAAPKDLISRDSMVIVMRDLVVLEAYIETRYQQVQSYHKIMTATGKQCLKGFNICPERFERSYNYYATRQKELQSIYSEVLDSLNMEVNRSGAVGGINADSISRINMGEAPNDFFLESPE